MKRFVTAVVTGMLLMLGDASRAQPAKPEPIYQVQADDAEMNAAKARAIASLPQFYQRLGAPAGDEHNFMVKFDILPGAGVEFVWATELDRSAVPMTGVLINQPVETSHRIGERVPIAETEIIDWAYFRGRVMQGGFTQRVLLGRMPPEEAAVHRQYLGW